MAWSDNLYVFGDSAQAASRNFAEWHLVLNSCFNMHIKSDSLCMLLPSTKKQGESTVLMNGLGWRSGNQFLSLGCVLSGTGEDASQRSALMSSWNHAFWANHGILTNRIASVESRMKFLRKLIFSIGDYHFAGIRPTASSAQQLDACINKLCRFVVGLKPCLGETAESFVRRRNSAISRQKSAVKFDLRLRLAQRLASWVEHCRRHPQSPACLCLDAQDDSWLRERRVEMGRFSNSRTLHAGETGTRSGGGFPHRWGSGWVEFVGESELGWDNPTRSKCLTRQRAEIIKNQFLSTASSQLAILDAG